jgi:hypothetical protein
MSDTPIRYEIEGEHDGHKFNWNLTLKPSSYKPAPITVCACCLGRGEVGGGLGSLDGPQQCSTCYGSGTIADRSFKWNPEPPKELVAALRKVWKDHWNKQQNDEFVLK